MVMVQVTTVPETLNFFHGQFGYLKKQGFEIHAVSSSGRLLDEIGAKEQICVHGVDMTRRITLWRDWVALLKLIGLFRKLKPNIVHAHTPKAGLLGVLAARIARVPIVVYTIHGLPFVTSKGLRRRLLHLSETLACRGAHQVFAVSAANRELVLREKICPPNKIDLIASGSVNGVDAQGRFNPLNLTPGTREKTREAYGIPRNSLVLGYVGRIVRDKGMVELAEAWQYLRLQYQDLYFLLVGPEESQDPVPEATMELFKTDPRVIFTGLVQELPPLYAAMDMLVLPTYREGFPITPLEAAAMKLPVVASRVDGCVEAVADGETGLLVPPRDSQKLTEALKQLIENPSLRDRMGLAGRNRVLNYFSPEDIWNELFIRYIALVEKYQQSSSMNG